MENTVCDGKSSAGNLHVRIDEGDVVSMKPRRSSWRGTLKAVFAALGVALCGFVAQAEDAVAQFNLGVRYYKGEGVVEDKAEAVKWYRKAAAQGHATAREVLEKLGEDFPASSDDAIGQVRRFCSQCGSRVDAADKFCSKCGNRLK